jgi:TnpA family transposase
LVDTLRTIEKLFRGLQELGRLVKTAYLAEYFREVELRRRLVLGLNKSKSLHSLARKVFFGSLSKCATAPMKIRSTRRHH